MTASFVSDYVFNLSKNVFSQTEINVQQKRLSFSPAPSFMNETDLRKDFNKFSRKMRCKWYFRNKTQSSKEIPTFHSISTWSYTLVSLTMKVWKFYGTSMTNSLTKPSLQKTIKMAEHNYFTLASLAWILFKSFSELFFSWLF